MAVHQRNRPTVIRMHGKRTHCEVEVPRAGQKKATRGKAGLSLLEIGSSVTVPLELLVEVSGFRFLRGRCDELGGILGRRSCYRRIPVGNDKDISQNDGEVRSVRWPMVHLKRRS